MNFEIEGYVFDVAEDRVKSPRRMDVLTWEELT